MSVLEFIEVSNYSDVVMYWIGLLDEFISYGFVFIILELFGILIIGIVLKIKEMFV